MINEIIGIIELVKNKVSGSSDVVWTRYDSAKKFRDDLDNYINRLKANDKSCLEELNIVFAPTGSLQEHSISNGWADEYIAIAERFDKLYHASKK